MLRRDMVLEADRPSHRRRCLRLHRRHPARALYAARAERLLDFVWRLINAAALAFIAVAVFCAGLSAILASVEYLFGVEIDGLGLRPCLVDRTGLRRPAFRALAHPVESSRTATPRSGKTSSSPSLRILPISSRCRSRRLCRLLHAYALKIVFSGELPRGPDRLDGAELRACALRVRIVAHPFARSRARADAALPRWSGPCLLLVPLVLLVFAVWQRVAAYGLTPERYALALFAVFLLVILVRTDRSAAGATTSG